MSGEEKRVLRLAQQGRLLPSDPARHRGEVGEMLRGRMCGCGAGGSCSTAHWLFDCQKREAAAARRLLCVEVKAAAREMEEGESRHEQSRALLRELQGEGRGDDRAEALRWVVGCVRKPPISGAAARKAALVVLKSAGTTLLVAEAMLKDDEEKAVKEVKARRAARRCDVGVSGGSSASCRVRCVPPPWPNCGPGGLVHGCVPGGWVQKLTGRRRPESGGRSDGLRAGPLRGAKA